MTCLIANTWRKPSSRLKVENFPYCEKEKAVIRKATPAECKAFAAMWNAR